MEWWCTFASNFFLSPAQLAIRRSTFRWLHVTNFLRTVMIKYWHAVVIVQGESGQRPNVTRAEYAFAQAFHDSTLRIQRIEQWTFLALQVIGGNILLPLIIATSLLSKYTPKHPIFLNFCLSWSLSSFFHCMLLYGERSTLLEGHIGSTICTTQAALVNGIQAMTSSTTLAMVMHIWNIFRQTRRNTPLAKYPLKPGIRNALFILSPYFIFAIFATATLVIVNQRPKLHGMYRPVHVKNYPNNSAFNCVVFEVNNKHSLLRGVYAFCAVLAFIALVFEGLTMVEIYLSKRETSIIAQTPPRITVMFVRIMTFSVYRTMILAFSLFTAIEPTRLFQVGERTGIKYNGTIDMLQAAHPLVAGIIFGSQKEFLSVWFSWKRSPPLEVDRRSAEAALQRLDMELQRLEL